MKIGLHDADAEHLKHKRFPNYALMKISAWHKSQGDQVQRWDPHIPMEYFDQVYSSKIFDFTPVNPYLPKDVITGGTGYDIYTKLPQAIDDAFPDYSLYSGCDYSIGYITRGCPNKCRWCVVPAKEGGIQPYRDWHDLVRSESKKLVLMDNNILASDYGKNQLASLIGSGYKIDLNQGMDARLVTPEIADILARLSWIRFIRFSCDQQSQIDPVIRVIDMLQRRGKKPYNVFVYVLVTADVEDAARRVEAISRYPGINIYAQAEQNPRLGITPNAIQQEFAQRYVYSGRYRKETWSEYQYRRESLAGAAAHENMALGEGL